MDPIAKRSLLIGLEQVKSDDYNKRKFGTTSSRPKLNKDIFFTLLQMYLQHYNETKQTCFPFTLTEQKYDEDLASYCSDHGLLFLRTSSNVKIKLK